MLGKDSPPKPFQLLAGIRSVKVAPKMSQNQLKCRNPRLFDPMIGICGERSNFTR